MESSVHTDDLSYGLAELTADQQIRNLSLVGQIHRRLGLGPLCVIVCQLLTRRLCAFVVGERYLVGGLLR